jgi:hypothetical protein
MVRVSRFEFTERYPVTVPGWKLRGIFEDELILERDADVSGILKRDLVVRSGVRAIVHGIVEGSVVVEPDAVVYLEAIVKGAVDVRGAGCLEGIMSGALTASPDAVVCLE